MAVNAMKEASQRQKVRSAIERIEALEQSLGLVARDLGSINKNHRDSLMLLKAVVEILGTDVVDAKIAEMNEREAASQVEAAKKVLAEGVEKGQFVKADVINDKSLMVGREMGADGNVLFPGYIQMEFERLKPEFKQNFLGQSPGFKLNLPDGNTFEVLETYDVLPAVTSGFAGTEG